MGKMYEVWLPVFQQGDDMAACLAQAEGNTPEAFRLAAGSYKRAAEVCTQLAAIAEKHHEFKVEEPNTHIIPVVGPEALLEVLAKEELLHTFGWDEDEEDEVLDGGPGEEENESQSPETD